MLPTTTSKLVEEYDLADEVRQLADSMEGPKPSVAKDAVLAAASPAVRRMPPPAAKISRTETVKATGDCPYPRLQGAVIPPSSSN